MTALRRQLEEARADYARGAYPGDLAVDVLSTPSHKHRPWLYALAAGGLAAAVLLGLLLMPWHGAKHELPPVALGTDLSIPGPPTMPQGLGVVPTYEPVIIEGPPAFPAMYSDVNENDSLQEIP